MFTVVSGLWCIHSGTRTVVCSQWYQDCGVFTVVPGLWCVHSGTRAVVCSQWYQCCGVFTVVPGMWCVHRSLWFCVHRLEHLDVNNDKRAGPVVPGLWCVHSGTRTVVCSQWYQDCGVFTVVPGLSSVYSGTKTVVCSQIIVVLCSQTGALGRE